MMNIDAKRRYNRHLILDQVGPEGQEKLMSAKVLVIGAGGLGCPILSYLTAAGVGKIGIVDFDKVDESNLQRQVLFRNDDIGQNKAIAAAAHLKALNPLVDFHVVPERLTTKNALNLFRDYDLIIDGTDNFSTRYLVNDAILITNKPLVYGSIYKFQGQVSVFNYDNGPSYRCLFPEPPKPDSIKNCSEIGVIGVLPGIIGAQQANEAIKIILGIGKPLSGKLMIYDALNASTTILKIERNDEIVKNVIANRDGFETYDYDLFCGVNHEVSEGQISKSAFEQLINDETFLIIDVRELWETPELGGDNVIRLPVDEIKHNLAVFDTEKHVVLVCQTGIRSAQVMDFLASKHGISNLKELRGGIDALNK